jgi:hypothetical protein
MQKMTKRLLSFHREDSDLPANFVWNPRKARKVLRTIQTMANYSVACQTFLGITLFIPTAL